jgi:hypothetical protein
VKMTHDVLLKWNRGGMGYTLGYEIQVSEDASMVDVAEEILKTQKVESWEVFNLKITPIVRAKPWWKFW